jgi:hypothetical protein
VSRAAVMGGQSLEPGQGDDGRVLGLSVAGDVDQPVVQVDRPQRLRRRPYAIGILVCLCVVTGCIGRVNDLVGQLTAPDEAVRRNAAFALGEIKDPRAVAPLITITGVRTSMVRGGCFSGSTGVLDAPPARGRRQPASRSVRRVFRSGSASGNSVSKSRAVPVTPAIVARLSALQRRDASRSLNLSPWLICSGVMSAVRPALPHQQQVRVPTSSSWCQ